MSDGCTTRVRDYTDLVQCGHPVLRSNRCAFHLHEEEEDLRAEIKHHEAEIAKCRKRLDELNTESG